MKIGDLIWYNCGGSKQRALVLDIKQVDMNNYWGDSYDSSPVTMALVHWCTEPSDGPRPRMHDQNGSRIYEHLQYGWVKFITDSGAHIFKVLASIT